MLPGRLGGGISERALARESLIFSAPAALALVSLALFGLISTGAALLGWLLSLAGGVWVALARLRELETIAAWIEGLPLGQEREPLAEAEGAISDRLLRPVSELGRQLRRQSGRMAAQQRMLRSVIEALPDPIMVVDRDLVVIQANAAARRSFEAPAPPVPLARILRDPGLLAAVTVGSGRYRCQQRVVQPESRSYQAVQLADRAGRPGRGRPRRPDRPARADRAGDDRADALRLRRQRQPRDQNTPGLDPGLHRDPARPGTPRPHGTRDVPGDHGRGGRPDGAAGRRSLVAVADRARGPPAAARAVRSRARR